MHLEHSLTLLMKGRAGRFWMVRLWSKAVPTPREERGPSLGIPLPCRTTPPPQPVFSVNRACKLQPLMSQMSFLCSHDGTGPLVLMLGITVFHYWPSPCSHEMWPAPRHKPGTSWKREAHCVCLASSGLASRSSRLLCLCHLRAWAVCKPIGCFPPLEEILLGTALGSPCGRPPAVGRRQPPHGEVRSRLLLSPAVLL